MEGGSWRPPAALLPESRVARGGMQRRPWMPPQLREAVRARGCDKNQGKISSSRLSSCGLGSSAVGEPFAVLSSGARQGHFWHQHSRLLISDPPLWHLRLFLSVDSSANETVGPCARDRQIPATP